MATHPGQRARIAVCLLLAAALAMTGVLLAAGLVWPEASGGSVKKKSGTTLDMSHVRDGYVMVRHKAGKSGKKLKARLTLGEQMYTYDLNGEGEYEVYPLQMGNGKYTLRVFQQVKGNQYAQASSQTFKVEGMDESAPFLCPNQYVWYEEDSPAVVKSLALCQGIEDDKDKAQAIFTYVKQHFTYDFVAALTLKDATGYLPDVDQVYDRGMGICFDLAAIMACMLRVQGIPTQLVIGYADSTYHAWNRVLLDGEQVLYDATAALAGMSVKDYTVERVY